MLCIEDFLHHFDSAWCSGQRTCPSLHPSVLIEGQQHLQFIVLNLKLGIKPSQIWILLHYIPRQMLGGFFQIAHGFQSERIQFAVNLQAFEQTASKIIFQFWGILLNGCPWPVLCPSNEHCLDCIVCFNQCFERRWVQEASLIVQWNEMKTKMSDRLVV